MSDDILTVTLPPQPDIELDHDLSPETLERWAREHNAASRAKAHATVDAFFDLNLAQQLAVVERHRQRLAGRKAN